MGKKSKMGWEDGPQGGQFGGGGPEIPGGFSQGPFHGPPSWVSYNVPPELRLGMTDVQENGTSRGGIPLYQGTDQYGREWQWSERGPIGYLDDEDGIWHNVSNQGGVWSDEWTDKNGNNHHGQLDPRGNWVDTWTDQNGKVHEGFLADGEWHEWPPGVQLESAWIGSRDDSGKVHHTATDDSGRKWDWFRDDQGEINLGYTDPEGNRHEVSEQDGIWHDRWTDQGGRDWHSTLGDQGETIWPDADLQEPPPEDFKDKTLAEPPPPYQGAPPEDFKDKALADDQAPTPGDFILDYPYAGEVQQRPPDDFKGKALSDDALHAQQQAAEGERGKALIDDAKQQAAEGQPPPPPEPPPKAPPVEPPPPPGIVAAGGVSGTGVAHPGVEGGDEDQPPPYGQFPMIKDPATGEWVPAIYDMETGEYHPLEGRADEGGEDQPPPVSQTPEVEPPVQPASPEDADDGGVPGMGVPYEDFIPFIPMVKDPTTGEWRNAYESEGGYTPDPEEVGGGDIIPEYRTLPWLEGDGEEGEQTPPGGDGDGVRLPGMEGPFVDVMPVMVQDPTTGEWLVKVTDPATGELRSPEPGESPNPNLSDLFDPTAPGPTLAPDLFNPNSPGPTLDPRLLLDPDSPGPTIDPALLDLTEPGPTIDPALLDPNSPGPTVEPALLDSNSPGPTIDPALLDPSAPGPTIDPAQLEQGIVEPGGGGVAEPTGVPGGILTEQGGLPESGQPEPSTTPRDDFDDPSALG